MKNYLIVGISFLSGLIAGAGGMYLYMKKKPEKDYVEASIKNDEEDSDDDLNAYIPEVSELRDYRRGEREQKEGFVDYRAAYKNDEEMKETEENKDVLEMDQFHENNKDRPPEIVEKSFRETLPNLIDEQTLYYYQMSDVIADEEGDLIPIDILLGDAFYESNFERTGSSELYIMNYQNDCVYRIERIEDRVYESPDSF